ncbi:MAG: hypothetical protein JST87_01135 [Bacteroidetes bacterium]|nr:hypothetical protein [Bacteroidota bacterium]MBS1934806.1 hypothetical protein [Bacteroidota bacterium]
MKLLYPFKLIARLFKNLYFLIFLNGFLFASILYFKIQASYENELFTTIQKNINKKIDLNDTQDSIVVKIMQTCNSLLGNRAPVFTESDDLDGVEVNYIHPASIDLMTARGACGSYSLVLARLLQNYNLPVRIAQMKANGIYGAHNVVETKIQSGWVVLDPTFDLYFVTPENKLASFTDVKKNWGYYSKQVPKEYNNTYRYEDVRYTNWTKIPIVLPLTKKLLDIIFGKEKSNTICVRMIFLRIYDVYFYVSLVLFILFFILTLGVAIKTKIFPEYSIPFTRSNIIKYLKLYFANGRIRSGIKA